MNLPFYLTVTGKSSVPEQLEYPPFWTPCWRLGRLAWRHCVHRPKRVNFKEDNISSKMVECAVVGCSKPNTQRFQRWISFHRLFKEWLVRIKEANFLKWPVSNLFGPLWEVPLTWHKPRKAVLGLCKQVGWERGCYVIHLRVSWSASMCEPK